MKFLNWNENKIDVNLFLTQYKIDYIFILFLYSHTDDPSKYKKSLIS